MRRLYSGAAVGNKEKREHNFALRLALFMAHVTAADIARRFKVSPSFAHALIRGTRRSRRVENGIAQMVGQPRSILWPKTSTPKL